MGACKPPRPTRAPAFESARSPFQTKDFIDSSDKSGYNRVISTLPRLSEAIIPIEKFTKYSLDYSRDFDKATAFNLALGYNQSNVDSLICNIKNNLANFACKEKGDIGFGMRYEVAMRLTRANGKAANVLTAWIDDSSNGEMRLTNAYVDRKRGLEND